MAKSCDITKVHTELVALLADPKSYVKGTKPSTRIANVGKVTQLAYVAQLEQLALSQETTQDETIHQENDGTEQTDTVTGTESGTVVNQGQETSTAEQQDTTESNTQTEEVKAKPFIFANIGKKIRARRIKQMKEMLKDLVQMPQWREIATSIGALTTQIIDDLGSSKEYVAAIKQGNKRIAKLQEEYNDTVAQYTRVQKYTEEHDMSDSKRQKTYEDSLDTILERYNALANKISVEKGKQEVLRRDLKLSKERHALRRERKKLEKFVTETKEDYSNTRGYKFLSGMLKGGNEVIGKILTISGNPTKKGVLDVDKSLDQLFSGHVSNIPLIESLLPPSIRKRIFQDSTSEEQAEFGKQLRYGKDFFKKARVVTNQNVLLPISETTPIITDKVRPVVKKDLETNTTYIDYIRTDKDGNEIPIDFVVAKRDKEGNEVLDSDGAPIMELQYAINPMAILGILEEGSKGSQTQAMSAELQDAIKLESLQVASSMIEKRSLKGREMERFITGAFGVERTSDTYMQLAQAISEGTVPESTFIQSAGRNILNSLHLKALNTVDSAIEDSLVTALGSLAVEAAVAGMTSTETSSVPHATRTFSVGIITDSNRETSLVTTPVFGEGTEIKVPIGSTVRTYNMVSIAATDEQAKELVKTASTFEYMGINGDKSQPQLAPFEPLVHGVATVRGSDLFMSERAVNYINKQMSKPRNFTTEFKQLWSTMDEVAKEENITINEAFYNYLLESEEDIRNAVHNDKVTMRINNSANKLVIDNMLSTFDLVRRTDEHPLSKNATFNAFYLPWDQTVSGRYMIDNTKMNPQNSKFTRFITGMDDMSAEMRVVDGKYDKNDIKLFQSAAAQALDHFLKKTQGIDKSPSEKVFKELTEDFFSIDAKTGKVTFPKDSILEPMVEALMNNEVVDLSKVPVNEKLHVYQLVAGLAQFETSEGKSFKHNLAIEMDAITSGMILTLLQIGSDAAVAFLEKGGVYEMDADGNTKYLNHQEALDNGMSDIYRTPADKLVELLETSRKERLKKAEKLDKEGNVIPSDWNGKSNMENLIDAFILKGDDKKWRGMMKYLVMYYIYGASLSTIRMKAGYDIGVQAIDKALATYADETPYSMFKIAYPNYVLGGEKPPYIGSERYNPYKLKTIKVNGKEQPNPNYDADLSQKTINAQLVLTSMLKGYNSQFPATGEAGAVNIFAQKDGDGKNMLPALEHLHSQLQYNFQYQVVDTNTNELKVLDTRPKRDIENKSTSEIESDLQKDSDASDMRMKNIVLSQETQKGIAEETDAAYGDLIENSFKETFPFLDSYRRTLKSVEATNFTVFKFKLKQGLEKYKDADGKITISKSQFKRIVADLTDKGYNYVSASINEDSWQDYSKDDKEAAGRVGVNGNFANGNTPDSNYKKTLVRTGTVYSKVPGMNIGANGVIDIHEIDAFLMSMSDSNDFQNIYDAYVMGLDLEKITETHGDYNYNVVDSARNHDVLGNAIGKTEQSLAKIDEDGELDDFYRFLEDQALVEQLAAGFKRIDPDYSTKSITETIDLISSQRSNNLSKGWLVNHLTATDMIPGVPVETKKLPATNYEYTRIEEVLTKIEKAMNNLANANVEHTTITTEKTLEATNEFLTRYLPTADVEAIQEKLKKFIEEC